MIKRDSHSQKKRPPMVLGGFEVAYVEPKKPSVWKVVLKRLMALSLVMVMLAVLVVAGADVYVRMFSKGLVHDDIEEIEAGRAGLVLGTSPWAGEGRRNLYFEGRMEAAAELFHAGRVTFLIVSGDNRHESYNEPREMRRALVARGVPADRIVYDFAGLRTLDSVIRAREVFGQERIVVISQRFHNERAVCLARHFGIAAEGFNARGPERGAAWWRNWVRERLARVQFLLDLYVLDSQPRHLGPRELVPEVPDPQSSDT